MAEELFAPPADELEEFSPPADEAFTPPEDEAVDLSQSRLSSGLNEAGRALAKTVTGTAKGAAQWLDSPISSPVAGARLLGNKVAGAITGVDRAIIDKIQPAWATHPGELISNKIGEADTAIDEALPTNPAYESEWISSKIPAVAGQAVGQLATALLPTKYMGLGAKAAQAIGLSQAGLLGLNAGLEEADRLGVKDPIKRSVMGTIFAGIESGSESFTALGSKSYSKMLAGEIRDLLDGKLLSKLTKTAAGEGLEEIAAEVPENIASTLARENEAEVPTINPTRADYWSHLAETFALGGIGGLVFGGAEAIGNRKTVDSAMAMRSAVMDHQNEILAKQAGGEALTPEEEADLSELSTYDGKLSTWLESKGVDQTKQRAGLATANAISSATRAGLPQAAEALRQVARASVASQSAYAPRKPAAIDPETAIEPTPTEPTPEQKTRSEAALVHSDEVEDTVYQNGEWVNAMGAPSPKAAELESLRQQYVQTGELPEGMQLAPQIAREEVVLEPERTPEAVQTEELHAEPPSEEIIAQTEKVPETISEQPEIINETPQTIETQLGTEVSGGLLPLVVENAEQLGPLQNAGESREVTVDDPNASDTSLPSGAADSGELPVLDAFESRLRETIARDSLKGWDEPTIALAVAHHANPQAETTLSPVRQKVVARVAQSMQTPEQAAEQELAELMEVRRIIAEERSKSEYGKEAKAERQDELDIHNEKTKTEEGAEEEREKPSLLRWADRVAEEEAGNLNAGLNPRLLAAHAVRAAWWIKKNGEDFATWSAEQIKRFGDAITTHLQKIWDTAKLLNVSGDEATQANREVSPRPAVPVAFTGWQDLDAMDAQLQSDALDEAWISFHAAGVNNGQSEDEIAAEWAKEMADPESARIESAVREVKQNRRGPTDWVPLDVRHTGETGSEIINAATGEALDSEEIRAIREKYGMIAQPSVSEDQDAAYLKAVERGDMETAQRMVDATSRKVKSPITVEKIRNGKYKITRDDGRVFNILQAPDLGRWIIEDAETFKTDSSKTLDGAKADIQYGWTSLTRKSADPITRDSQGNVIPLSQRFNQGSGDIRYSRQRNRRKITTGVTPSDVDSAIKGLSKILPNVATAWTGTRADLNKHLTENQEVKSDWKQQFKLWFPNATNEEQDQGYSDWIATGLDGQEGFTFNGRTYLITDQVGVYDGESPAQSARRVLIHEDAHEGLAYMRQQKEIGDRWKELRSEIPAEELNDLAKRYTWLKNWRTDERTWDKLADEWVAAQVEQIEHRGQPEPKSLLGRILQWFRDAWKNLMGTNLDPTDQALLDFMDASREARFRDRVQAQARGVNYSASDPSGGDDMTQARFFDVAGNPTGPDYNIYGRKKLNRIREYTDNGPEGSKYLTEVFGYESGESRTRQAWRPMIQFAKNKIGGIHGNIPELTDENTETAMNLARQLLSQQEFVQRLKEQFQDANPNHAGDAMGSIMQLELMDYGQRLLAEKGDSRILDTLGPVANDAVITSYLNASGLGRGLGSRALVNKENGYFTALQMLMGKMEEVAEIEAGGEDKLKAVVDSTRSVDVEKEVNDELQPTFDRAADEAAATATEYEEEGWWDQGLEILDSEERALAVEFERRMRRLTRLAQLINKFDVVSASSAQPSMEEDFHKEFGGDIEAIKKAFEEEKSAITDLLRKLTKQDTSSELKSVRRTRTKITPEARKALNADAQAKKLLERYEDRNKRVKREKPAWRKVFEQQVRQPQDVKAFTAEMVAHGISPESASKLYKKAGQISLDRQNKLADKIEKQGAELMEREKAKSEGRELPKTAKAPTGRVNSTAFLNEVVRQILNSPLNKQGVFRGQDADGDPLSSDKDGKRIEGHGAGWNPQWVEDAFTNAFIKQGVPQDRAREMAKKLAPKAEDILRRAQEKAAVTTAKKLDMDEPKIDYIRKAIRGGGLVTANANPIVAGLAAKAGFKPLLQEDLHRLAQLDEIMNEGSPTKFALASVEMSRILSKVSPDKRWHQVLEQLFVNGALSSTSVFGLNIAHPPYILARKLVDDLMGLVYDTIGKRGGSRSKNLQLMGSVFTSLWEARQGMLATAKFSLVNDAYRNRQAEYLNSEHQLYTNLMKALEELKDVKNPAKALWGGIKTVWLSSDWVRRILATADETWGNTIQSYVLRNEAMRTLVQKAGLTIEQANLMMRKAADAGSAEEAKMIKEGRPWDQAKLIGQDFTRDVMQQQIADVTGSITEGKMFRQTGEKEAQMELGNRRSEESPWWDLPNTILEAVKSATSTFRAKVPLLGRPVTGFISVGANLLNRSFYLTPLGFLRVSAKLKHSQRNDFYKETMATDGAVRMRMNEAITSTIAILILAALRWDKDDKQEGMVITGDGPENRGVREAWMKEHKPFHVEFRNGDGKVMASFAYTRGGMDHTAVALTALGTLDDLELDGKKVTDDGLKYGWDYLTTWGSNQARQAQFFALKALLGSAPKSDKPEAMSAFLGYSLNPMTPWGGLTKSTAKIFSGQQDESSSQAAILSQMPVLQTVFGSPGPKLNYLGDQVGMQPENALKKIAERLEFAGAPIFIGVDPAPKDEELYSLILRKGASPALPLRSELEARNGWIPDERWSEYVKTRGEIIKQSMRAKLTKLERLEGDDVKDEIEKISRDSTRAAKTKMGLK